MADLNANYAAAVLMYMKFIETDCNYEKEE